jgi:hypothetical protein
MHCLQRSSGHHGTGWCIYTLTKFGYTFPLRFGCNVHFSPQNITKVQVASSNVWLNGHCLWHSTHMVRDASNTQVTGYICDCMSERGQPYPH